MMKARLFLLALFSTLPVSALAQTSELTSADRLALLYSSQLQFDEQEEPLVKVGIDDGLEELTFKSNAAITVLPSGPGGPEVSLPKGRYTIHIDDGHPGGYDYHVVLGTFAPNELDALHEAENRWRELGLETHRLELGSLFAIAGEMFDTRQTLLVTGQNRVRDDVDALRKNLEQRHDLELSLHAELAEYPTGLLSLTNTDSSIAIRHNDVLWVELSGRAELLSGNHEGRTYSEFLVFTADRQGLLALVNAVHVEEVLRGVVPAEIYATAPLESLKAQAVAARGTLVSQIGVRHLADPYNLCDEQHCQVFKGMNASRDSTDKAVEATRGQILFDGGKRIAETYYSSNCGGLSERPEAVWGLSPKIYLHAHTDDHTELEYLTPPTEAHLRELLTSTPEAHCNTSRYGSGKHFRWSRSFTAKELNALVKKKYDIGSIQDITIVERGPGGRIVQLELVGSKGRVTVERELTVRRLFGGLKSGFFVLDIERNSKNKPKRFTFTGGGFGHGVGMCQTGAMNMAHKGFDVTEILRHYYLGSELKTVW